MEELQDASIHHMTAKVISAIKNTKCYEPLFKELQRLVCNPAVDTHDMRNTLEDAIKGAGLETEIRNIVYNLVRSRLTRPDEKTQASKQNTVCRPFSIFHTLALLYFLLLVALLLFTIIEELSLMFPSIYL